MRVVVIGPYPPTADPAGDDVLACVRRWRTEGARVVVVSPEPSAAHHHGDPATWAGAMRVSRVVRGADRVVWFDDSRRATATPLRGALARVAHVEHRALGSTQRATQGRAWRWSLSRVRAGAPTAARSIVGRLRRARS